MLLDDIMVKHLIIGYIVLPQKKMSIEKFIFLTHPKFKMLVRGEVVLWKGKMG